jgi:hypothetical protein
MVDPDGSSASMASDVVKGLERESRTVLLPDVFQTGTAKAPRPGDPSVGSLPSSADSAHEEARADASAGDPKFLTFNLSVDAARVQDILTAIAWANKNGAEVELYASGDAALWATFAAAVSDVSVALHVENVPEVDSNSDYVQHFNVPGIRRAGGLPVAQELAGRH